jgi:MFS family permease
MTAQTSVRNAYLLLFASQIINIGFGLLAIFITLLADEIHLRPFEIGMVVSIFMVARALAASFIPAISDQIGRKKILVVALFAYALSTILLGFSRDFMSLFLLRIIEGAATGAAFPTAEALLVDSVSREDRGAWMGKYFTTFTFGFIIGPALGGVLFSFASDILLLDTLTSFIIPFLFTGILGFLAMLFIIVFVSDVYSEKSFDRQEQLTYSKSDLHTPYYSSFLLVAVLSGFAIGLIIPIFTLYMTDFFFLTEGTIGFIFTISGTTALLVNYPAGKLSDRLKNRMSIVTIGMVFAGLGFIGVGFSTTIIMAIFFFIFRQMSFQAFLPAYRAFQADKIPPMIRGKVMGRIQSAFNVGGVIGPLIGTSLYELYSTRTLEIFNYQFFGGGVPFLLAGLFGVVQVFIAIYILQNENKNSQMIKESYLASIPASQEI